MTVIIIMLAFTEHMPCNWDIYMYFFLSHFTWMKWTFKEPLPNDSIFFSSIHCKFTKMDYIMGHKTSLSGFKRIQVRQNMFCDQMELNNKNLCKNPNSGVLRISGMVNTQSFWEWCTQRGHVSPASLPTQLALCIFSVWLFLRCILQYINR